MRQRNSGLGKIWVLLATEKKDGNWLRIESGTNAEMALAKNKEGSELKTKDDFGTRDIATTPI